MTLNIMRFYPANFHFRKSSALPVTGPPCALPPGNQWWTPGQTRPSFPWILGTSWVSHRHVGRHANPSRGSQVLPGFLIDTWTDTHPFCRSHVQYLLWISLRDQFRHSRPSCKSQVLSENLSRHLGRHSRPSCKSQVLSENLS
jgi:hypothetical protein